MTQEHVVRPCLGWLQRADPVACDPEQDDADWPYDDRVIGTCRRCART